MTMEKDAYYFPHFCNARHDRKIKRVRKELGIEGYAIFFMLLEVLREQLDYRYPMKDIDLLAEEFGTSEQKTRTIICNYNLFELDENEQFFSPKLFIYMQPYFDMKEQRRLAGIESGKARRLKAEENEMLKLVQSNDRSTDDERELNENEQSKVKESKEKKKKENNIYTVEFEKFYSFYPNSDNKQQTFKNWNTCLKTHSIEQIMQATQNYKKKVEVEGREKQYIKNSSNFLGKEKVYMDYILCEPVQQNKIAPLKMVMRDSY